MNAHMDTRPTAPWWVTIANPLAKRLLGAGISLGPNGLVTVPGRTSGEPRTTPLAIIESDDRRWVWAPWGEVQWVRNLRAAGHATVTVGGRDHDVAATELNETERVGFFRDVLRPLARSVPFGMWFIRTVDGVDLDQPAEAADGRYVFELTPADGR